MEYKHISNACKIHYQQIILPGHRPSIVKQIQTQRPSLLSRASKKQEQRNICCEPHSQKSRNLWKIWSKSFVYSFTILTSTPPPPLPAPPPPSPPLPPPPDVGLIWSDYLEGGSNNIKSHIKLWNDHCFLQLLPCLLWSSALHMWLSVKLNSILRLHFSSGHGPVEDWAIFILTLIDFHVAHLCESNMIIRQIVSVMEISCRLPGLESTSR